ncbi:MAG: hypothetical protein JSS49_13565 [Planctomycetes bacterium]|nr:hypothetical protein [Planctomycetota bacterium]
MWVRPRAPTVPPELTSRFGEPELVFGPNVRFRIGAAACGFIFVVVGAFFYLMGWGAGGAQLPLANWVSGKLAIPLVVLGVVILLGMRLVPLNWVFVCPGGVIRTRGTAWDGIGWTEVERFEDATLVDKSIAIRKCRLVLSNGSEWGFLADYVAEYPQLATTLSRRVSERVVLPARSPAIATQPGAAVDAASDVGSLDS